MLGLSVRVVDVLLFVNQFSTLQSQGGSPCQAHSLSSLAQTAPELLPRSASAWQCQRNSSWARAALPAGKAN